MRKTLIKCQNIERPFEEINKTVNAHENEHSGDEIKVFYRESF